MDFDGENHEIHKWKKFLIPVSPDGNVVFLQYKNNKRCYLMSLKFKDQDFRNFDGIVLNSL